MVHKRFGDLEPSQGCSFHAWWPTWAALRFGRFGAGVVVGTVTSCLAGAAACLQGAQPISVPAQEPLKLPRGTVAP